MGAGRSCICVWALAQSLSGLTHPPLGLSSELSRRCALKEEEGPRLGVRHSCWAVTTDSVTEAEEEGGGCC